MMEAARQKLLFIYYQEGGLWLFLGWGETEDVWIKKGFDWWKHWTHQAETGTQSASAGEHCTIWCRVQCYWWCN